MPGENLTRIEAQERAALVRTRSPTTSTLDLTRAPRPSGRRRPCGSPRTEGARTFIDAITRDGALGHPERRGARPAPRSSDGSRIQLDGLAAENELIVDRRRLYTNTGEGLHRFVDPVDGEVYLYTPVRGARTPAACSRCSSSPT